MSMIYKKRGILKANSHILNYILTKKIIKISKESQLNYSKQNKSRKILNQQQIIKTMIKL
jgi:hypothetical protein